MSALTLSVTRPRGNISVVKDIDNSQRILADLKELMETSASIGVIGKDDSDLLLIANVHEFGAPKAGIPERSYIRAGYDKNVDKYIKKAEGYLQEVLDGKIEARSLYTKLGQTMAQDIQKHIKGSIPPPLKPATVKRKGSSLPLVDTGRLLGSIGYEVK